MYAPESLKSPSAPASIVEVQLQSLDNRVCELMKVAAVLEARLARVLRQPDAPPSENTIGAHPCTGVPLADMLAGQATRLQDAVDYLNTIIERIEL